MASSFGFVYLLGNNYMPDVYKIGFSDRAPHQRAEELSASTSCPSPFRVICYVEVPNASVHEQQFHKNFAKFRISPNREFFHIKTDLLSFLLSSFHYYPGRLACCSTDYQLEVEQNCAEFGVDSNYCMTWDVYKSQTRPTQEQWIEENIGSECISLEQKEKEVEEVEGGVE